MIGNVWDGFGIPGGNTWTPNGKDQLVGLKPHFANGMESGTCPADEVVFPRSRELPFSFLLKNASFPTCQNENAKTAKTGILVRVSGGICGDCLSVIVLSPLFLRKSQNTKRSWKSPELSQIWRDPRSGGSVFSQCSRSGGLPFWFFAKNASFSTWRHNQGGQIKFKPKESTRVDHLEGLPFWFFAKKC